MNFVFNSYPDHPWIAEWTFEPHGCSTAFREKCRDHFFRSQATVGQLVPHVDAPEWALQIPVPQNSRTNLLANGFCAYFERRKVKCGAEVFTPEPGVLWGRFMKIPPPVLAAENMVESNDNVQWIESDTVAALLMLKDDHFCLVTTSHLREEAEHTAASYLQKDFEAYIQQEWHLRSGAINLFEEMTHHDSLTAICVESMLKALRPPEGRIPHRWSQSSVTESPRLDMDELYPLALAWSMIDPRTAEELVLCALKIQSNSGALPIHFSPHKTYSLMEAPKPLIAKTAEIVWRVRKDQEFLKNIMPLLRRYIQWMLHHFDPKRRGTYSWKSQSEPIVPSQYQTDLVTVDLAALLLTEIEALNRLQKQSEQHASQQLYFEQEHTALVNSMSELFWNNAENAFSLAYLRDTPVPLRGFSEIAPLLWTGLTQSQKSAIIEHMRESDSLPGQQSVLSWHQSSLDDNSFPLLQQFLVFQALKSADPQGSVLSDFSRVTLQSFVEWHTISQESNHTLRINPAVAAYILNVQSIHQYRYHAKGAVSRPLFRILRRWRADRTDLMVIAATLIVLYCVHAYYDLKQAPPPLDSLVTGMNSAYAGHNSDETLKNCFAIITYYPEDAARARLLAANVLMLNGEYATAAELYEQVRKEYPDSPSAMISLGLARQLQGQFSSAETNYYEFCYLFDEIFPNVVKEVSDFRYLMEEGFSTPPKWQKIYRYRFMHELE